MFGPLVFPFRFRHPFKSQIRQIRHMIKKNGHYGIWSKKTVITGKSQNDQKILIIRCYRYIYISALERAEQKQSIPQGGAFNRDNDLGAPHLLFLSKAIPQCHDSHTLFLTLKLCAQWSPDSLHLWKRIAINLAVEDVQMISSSEKNVFESFILNSLELYDHRQLLESSNLKIALVSNATDIHFS